MSNVCVACGSEIPDECGSMICKQCQNKVYKNTFDFDIIYPKSKDIIIAYYNSDNTTVDELRSMYDNLTTNFPQNQVIVVPDFTQIGTIKTWQIKKLIKNLKKEYKRLKREM